MKPLQSRICVVGAGPAGLAAAYYLKQKGYKDLVVLEAELRVGGKCRTVQYCGRSFDIGANYVTSAYTEVLKLAASFGAELYTESPVTTATMSESGGLIFHDPLTAVTRNQSFLRFVWAAIRYLVLRFRLCHLIDPPGFEHVGRHEELCVSFREWLKNNRLSALEPLFEFPVTVMGYGYLDEIAAPYVLKYIDVSTYLNLLAVGLGLPRRWPKRFIDGFERLWQSIASTLDVRLATKIASIDRSGPIRVHLNDHAVMEFDYLILACQLDRSSLRSFLSLSGEEDDLFGRVRHNKYVVASFDIEHFKLPKRIVGISPTPELGQPWAITQQYSDNNFVQFYTRLRNDSASSAEQFVTSIRQVVHALGADPPGDPITYNEWNYFPHVTAEDIRSGFFDRLERLQGQANTFYCGNTVAFELVETVVAYSHRVVKKYF